MIVAFINVGSNSKTLNRIFTMTIKGKNRLLTIILFMVGIGMFYGGFIDGRKISRQNIKEIKGTLNTFRFDSLGRQRYDYQIYLNESSKSFQITAILVDYFDKSNFKKSINKNDTLEMAYIEIPGLIFPDRNILLSINGNKKGFLSLEDSFVITKGEGDFARIFSVICLIASLIIMIVPKIRRKADANN
jgi:hypothetical protein